VEVTFVILLVSANHCFKNHKILSALDFNLFFTNYRVCINYRRILQSHFPPTLVYAFPARWQ